MSDFPPSATTESEPMWGISYEADFTEGTWTFKMVGHDWEVSAGSYAIIYNDEYQDLLKRANGTASEKRVAWQDCTRCGAAILNEHQNAAQVPESASLGGRNSLGTKSPGAAPVFEDALDVMSGRVPSAAATTFESERAALVAEVGECCMGRDPLCAGGCLVQQAIRKRSAPSSARLATDLCDAPLDRTAIDAVAFDLRMTLYALLDRDITFDGRNAVLPFESHDQAINHISEARRKAR